MSFSAKMMNLGMRKVYDYLEKDPKTNLPKLMEMIDKVLPESVYAPQRKVFREILENQDNNWFELIESGQISILRLSANSLKTLL